MYLQIEGFMVTQNKFKIRFFSGGKQEETRKAETRLSSRATGNRELPENPRRPDHHGQAPHGPHRALLLHQLRVQYQRLGILFLPQRVSQSASRNEVNVTLNF
jgi:hypothetical protein